MRLERVFGGGPRDARMQPIRATAASIPAERPRGARLRVLVVDDDDWILATVRDILAAEGYDVLTARGGREAVAMTRTARPGLLLLDMRMRDLDGWGVARAVREYDPGIGIIVMTAAANARRWAEEVAADAYIAKPFHLADLLRCIERFERGDPRD